MNSFVEAFAWLTDPANYPGSGGILQRASEHLMVSVIALVIASLIAIPIGFFIGHTGRGRSLAIVVSGGVRALPTLGLVTILALGIGIGVNAPIISLVVLAIPSILAGAYSGFEAVDRPVVDAARAVGMTELQIVRRVEMPLGLSLLIGGLRLAMLQIIATAPLAAYVGGGGLGSIIFVGLANRDYGLMLAGSILVVIIAIGFEIIFSILQRLVVPAGVRATQLSEVRSGSNRSATAAA